MRIALGVFAGYALIACAHGSGGGHGDDDGDGGTAIQALTLDPPASDLVVMNGVPAHATFAAKLTLANGTTRDVTADTHFTIGIDTDSATFTANELTIGVAARTQVTAEYSGVSAHADVVAHVKSVRVDPQLSPAIVDLFNQPLSVGFSPQIKYPPANTVMPRNLGDFEIHWTDAHANNVFEISLHTELSDVRVYVPGGNGLPAKSSWGAFSASEWLAAVATENALTFQVRGINTSAIGTLGTVDAAPPVAVQLSNEVMDGGLYYWAAISPNSIGIFRHDMKKPGQPAEPFLTGDPTQNQCIACHVLSRDGTKMAITYQTGTNPGLATMVDVATKGVVPATNSWNFGTFTPDNAQFLSVENGKLVVRNATTQAVLATMSTAPANAWVTHPDLSPDGKMLVYVRPATAGTDLDFGVGQIYRRTYDPATYAFGAETPLVADGKNNFYPSWSPDGKWILFTRNASIHAYDDNNSSVWVIRSDGSQAPVELAKANDSLGITNSWARWAPFAQTLGAVNEPMWWVTMSSKRDFGVRLVNTGLPQRAKRAQLWMTPFFPMRASQGRDPSTPAFRLPFQNFDSSNHIAQWTERVVVIQ